eukprot:3619758-Rhodomonas_salina.2
MWACGADDWAGLTSRMMMRHRALRRAGPRPFPAPPAPQLLVPAPDERQTPQSEGAPFLSGFFLLLLFLLSSSFLFVVFHLFRSFFLVFLRCVLPARALPPSLSRPPTSINTTQSTPNTSLVIMTPPLVPAGGARDWRRGQWGGRWREKSWRRVKEVGGGA